ncbi:5'/3'-nucleotidase SurE [Thorsellia anophelis]|uniref:5'-nucleotidase n=1 Tax=Thorsellia anophelis DSM 18579 TaxID=1123402 RepID=A0A1I0ARX9_9GAMM|nr:5'/3'-nucleotidase SurE [Thorsellia anophelis]SES97125.1 5'/3'-nucleotidase SurE [Thorsellia anophelis DSM 18579]
MQLKQLAVMVSGVILTQVSLSAGALNIVLSNDDGYTSNLKAIYAKLTEDGHNVIASVPCQNQSGKGGSINFSDTLTTLTEACLNDAAPAGAPAFGEVNGEENIYYVNGTPIMSLMYGLDVVAPQVWGANPKIDLVISGANEGQNVGSIVNSSGTVGNAQFALSRGIPAVAISADANTTNNDELAAEVALLTSKIIKDLESKVDSQGRLLPEGYGLNINYPMFEAGDRALELPWKVTQFGTFNAYNLKFTVNQNGSANIGFDISSTATEDQANDESVAYQKGFVTFTMMQHGFEGNAAAKEWLKVYMNDVSSKTDAQ